MFEEELVFNVRFYFDKGKEMFWEREKKIIMGCFAICNATQAFPAFPKRIDIVALNLPVL